MEKPLATVSGKVTDIFAHRFVVQSHAGKFLADFGKHNAKTIHLTIGDEVELFGEQKPSELKVHRMTVNGEAMPLEMTKKHTPKHGKKHEAEDEEGVDPAIALQAAKSQHMSVIGQPRRKPKHFELLGKDETGHLLELHIEFDGTVRKTKPVEVGDEKWEMELKAA